MYILTCHDWKRCTEFYFLLYNLILRVGVTYCVPYILAIRYRIQNERASIQCRYRRSNLELRVAHTVVQYLSCITSGHETKIFLRHVMYSPLGWQSTVLLDVRNFLTIFIVLISILQLCVRFVVSGRFSIATLCI